jgi:hypothetical protein
LFLLHERRAHSALPRVQKLGEMVRNTEDGGRLF